MKPLHETELADLIIQWVGKNTNVQRARRVKISRDTDLMESQLLDSLGFVELMMFVEAQTGQNIDLTDVDPQEFAVIEGLSRIALGAGRKAAASIQ